ncbi:MAG: polysaccharide ABC transporter ATP-binding protein [Calothrix sp. MO_167.B12]|nr:polysaccharide ABC transporter ATP-binding protein [Calothrix sp. MO_167.B12]
MTIINEQEIGAAPQDNPSDIVLSVNGVSKKFCRDLKRSLMYGVQDIASELLGLREKSDKLRKKEFWALNNVSFQLKKGEALGLVGKNGSGKSTLLRIIAGLIKPDTGSVEVNGRVAPLIALGAGFNPILTGRENIYANMAILGLSKKEIDERFDEVVEFAEIGDAIDAPVQSYSSGMAARLGFASAIHTEPDILLIDEVLAVGDMSFRAKCYRQLSKLRGKKTSLILVSHDPNSILAVCESAVYISQGDVILAGETHEIMQKYEEDILLKDGNSQTGSLFLTEKDINESMGLDITHVYFKDENNNILETPISSSSTDLCIGLKASMNLKEVDIVILIHDKARNGERILRLSSSSDINLFNFSPGKHEIKLQMPVFCLRPGSYVAKIYLTLPSLFMLDMVEAFHFKVDGFVSMSECSFYQPRSWHHESSNILLSTSNDETDTSKMSSSKCQQK